ncbi:hypothetical protein B0H14DRAFT_3532078 [Mycena olivaceomarginata]|nr:hypothetical protein B0H14DRAFT_3532078 [Mycena olivaceomarginata]
MFPYLDCRHYNLISSWFTGSRASSKAVPPLGSDPTKRAPQDTVRQILRLDFLGATLVAGAIAATRLLAPSPASRTTTSSGASPGLLLALNKHRDTAHAAPRPTRKEQSAVAPMHPRLALDVY